MNACALWLSAALSLSQPPLSSDLPPGVLPVSPGAQLPVRVITLEEFAATFRPVPGTYEITFLHPRKKCPVNVTFTLPPGCPKMRVHKFDIEFDYGKHEVEIRFGLCGKVIVTTR